MKTPESKKNCAGFALISYMIIALVVAGSVAAMLAYSSNINHQTRRHIASSSAFHAAEAGVDKVNYELAVTENWEAISPTTQETWVNLSNGDSYAVKYSDVDKSTVTVNVIGRSPANEGYTYRQLRARFGRDAVPEELMNYAIFGNSVGFHNHMEEQSAFTITSDVFANDELLFWRGLKMDGYLTSAGTIVLEDKPTSFPFLYETDKLIAADSGSPFYGPAKSPAQPIPEKRDFPTFDFEIAKQTAIDEGTYFSSASAFLAYIDARKTTYSTPQPYDFPAPIPSNPNRVMKLTNSSGSQEGILSITKLYDSVFYVEDRELKLEGDCNEVLFMTNCTLVVDGKLKIQQPTQIYSEGVSAALVATQKIDITDKDHTDGNGGPVTVRGLIYASESGEIHIHQTDPYNAVNIKGSEAAGYVHNCEWFWFEFAAPVNAGVYFGGTAGGAELLSWHEVPYVK